MLKARLFFSQVPMHAIKAVTLIFKVQVVQLVSHLQAFHRLLHAAAWLVLHGRQGMRLRAETRQLRQQRMQSIQSMHLEKEACGVARVKAQGLRPRGRDLQLLHKGIILPAGPFIALNLNFRPLVMQAR